MRVTYKVYKLKERATRMRKHGYTYQSIGDKLGCSHATIYKLLNQKI